MKEQSRIFKCTVLIAVSSLVLTILLEWKFDRLFYQGIYILLTGHRAFIINIGLGVFTGAILSSGIARISYQYQKKKYIDDCCEYLTLFAKKLSKVKYLYLLIDMDLLCRWNDAIDKEFDLKLSDEIKREMLRWYKSNCPDISPEILCSQDLAREKELPKIIESYNEFLQFDISNIEALLAQRDPQFKNTKVNRALENAMNHIRVLYGTIEESLEHMVQFGSKANQLKTIDKLQKVIFDEVEHVGSIVLLPPQNKEVRVIDGMRNQIQTGKNEKVNEQHESVTEDTGRC